MAFFWFAILIITLYSVNKSKIGGGKPFARDTTDSVKGVFILFVFINHAVPYIVNSGGALNRWMDFGDLAIRNWMGQLIVALFLFYSGYGVTCGIINKGASYVKSIPRKRILKVLFDFDVAVLCFLALSLVLGQDITLRQTLLSFVCWDSLGNSNWYIFCILYCYFATWLSFRVTKNSCNALCLLCLLTITYCIVMSFFKPWWWFDTICCFPAGAICAQYRDKIMDILKKRFWLIFVLSLSGCIVFHDIVHIGKFGITTNIRAVCLCIFVLSITSKVSISGTLLQWLGKNLFPLYIYQRIPMIALSSISGGAFCAQHPYLFIIASAFLTLPFVWCYKNIRFINGKKQLLV